MGLYSQFVFPWICDLVLSRPVLANYRKELLSQAHGEILEIGFGTGLNLPHYPEGIGRLTTIDPNAGMMRRARRRIEQSRIEVRHRLLRSEQLPFADNTFDCVVSTFTLCSINDVNQALGEVYRVLRLGGQFLFLEHGLSRDPRIQKWQRRLNRLEQWLADGCRLDRNIKALVTAQPFGSVQINEDYVRDLPATHGYLYRGSASKTLRGG
jgi:ubiquinone/menaquinone biosynthesis C-methylase UbiE